MRFDEDKNRIIITVTEFVAISRRCVASAFGDEDEPEISRQGRGKEGGECPEELTHCFSDGKTDYILIGIPNMVGEDSVTLMMETTRPPERPRSNEVSQLRGEAFILGYILAMREGLESVELVTVYTNIECGKSHEVRERVEFKRLKAFFSKCVGTVSVFAVPQVERVKTRLPSMKAAKFPYPTVREGQAEFIRASYRAIATGGRLIAGAPTGTGKTVSALYPAIKALGEGRIDKAFYLTPKTTTQLAAKECLDLFSEKGAVIKAVILTAKDKICRRGRLCKTDRRLCESSRCSKMPEAVLKLYSRNVTVAREEDILEVAHQFKVCPYELSLTYSELCDIVICDINYLFDPSAYIRRFFTEGGCYAFLIDEAHNLPDRMRSMYSTELSDELFRSMISSPTPGALSGFAEQAERWRDELTAMLFPYVKEELREDKEWGLIGAQSLSRLPEGLLPLVRTMEEALDKRLMDSYASRDEEAPTRVSFYRDLLHTVRAFGDGLAAFDSGYRLFIFHQGGKTRVKLYLLDPSELVRSKISKGSSAVFFSATLQPMSYYKSLLGLDKDGVCLAVPSPFDSDSVSVSIMDRISTRYSERERTLPAVCRAIGSALSARRGNYMVFAPSFEYAEALCSAFRARYPKIKSIAQTKDMTSSEKQAFLDAFATPTDKYLVGFCVLGGIYSEGVDLVGESLIGAIIVGIGMPSLSYERERMAEYFEDKFEQGKEFAYVYPGMNRVFQAAGRVIRSENDRGVIVLIDDRFADPLYKKSIPDLWRSMRYIEDADELSERLKSFWSRIDKESISHKDT